MVKTKYPRLGPFILVKDDDSHWYIIPKERELEWHAFLSSEHYDDGNVPEWAEAIGGSPSLVLITGYRYE